MTKDDAAAALNGCEYGAEGSPALWEQMKAAGLVAVFGYSDDGMEFRGAVTEEFGAGTVLVAGKGTLPDRDSIEDDAELEDFFARRRTAKPVKALFDDGGYTFRYDTPIPHATFIVREDGEPDYCEGIVFAPADVPA